MGTLRSTFDAAKAAMPGFRPPARRLPGRTRISDFRCLRAQGLPQVLIRFVTLVTLTGILLLALQPPAIATQDDLLRVELTALYGHDVICGDEAGDLSTSHHRCPLCLLHSLPTPPAVSSARYQTIAAKPWRSLREVSSVVALASDPAKPPRGPPVGPPVTKWL